MEEEQLSEKKYGCWPRAVGAFVTYMFANNVLAPITLGVAAVVVTTPMQEAAKKIFLQLPHPAELDPLADTIALLAVANVLGKTVAVPATIWAFVAGPEKASQARAATRARIGGWRQSISSRFSRRGETVRN